MQFVATKPPKCSLTNLHTGESVDCLFNPTALSEEVSVEYSKQAVRGMSHQPLQYNATGNRQLPALEFYLDKFFAQQQPSDPDILDFRGFLRALTVPPSSPAGLGAPPRLLFVWPNVITIETVVRSLKFDYEQFAADASVLIYRATCVLEEILDQRVTSEQRREGV